MDTDYLVLNIKQVLGDESFSDVLPLIIDGFDCPQNKEVCNFLKKSAVEFSKKKQSITYLVIEPEEASVVGYFTLAVKPIQVKADCLSKAQIEKLERFGKCDKSCGLYTISAYLIAQLGKNFAIPKEKQIPGNTLLELAEGVLSEVQTMIGGGFIFLECEPKEKLTDFYERNNYKQYSSRISESEGIELLQYLKHF